MTSTFFQRLLIIILLAGTVPTLWAQEYKYEIGGMAGGAFYMGDANKNTIFKGMNPAVGAVFRYNINFRWALKANLMWGQVSGKTEGMENVFPNNAQTSFNRSIMELGGQAEFNFFPYSDKFDYAGAKRFSPYVLVGIGLTVAPGGGKTFASPNIPLGVGMKYKIKNRLNLGCEFSFRKLFGDGLEGKDMLDDPYGVKGSALKNKDWYSFLLLSVTCSVRYLLLHLMFGFLLGFRSLPTQPGIQTGKAELPADLRSLEGLSILGEPDSLYVLRFFYLPGALYKFQPDAPAKQVIVELFPCFGVLQSCLDGIEDFVFHTLRSMEFLHISLALALGVCQPVLVLKQFRGDFITLVVALGRDYLAVISDAVIDQVAVRIVRVMVSYQNKLSVFYPHQFHVFPGYFSHKFIRK